MPDCAHKTSGNSCGCTSTAPAGQSLCAWCRDGHKTIVKNNANSANDEDQDQNDGNVGPEFCRSGCGFKY
ncbi:hypothetical protein GE21DRAFT_3409 [Neurospora crassa]|uniref:Uncharacterized protein n=2 Tax=Neurospora crassa TaxID=5141 RepID=Q1K4W7_NEUCR|nr:hypothetical protein NCU01579 [Neurospora crassa OR74A]EAA26980.1 hypothetical protein NCU01579 [Neurospora crassa OR74A]KHE87157.1 hypothetical protein GE21DRAFT_3409 [Neurospora crassa]CAB91385.2 hypothetical protein [Neurospora crassa]|eukprot:XP_956216.1 hypothetical protein NCU01579 [Neurospora crassa OR74A]